MRELSGLADEVGGELVFLVHACVALAQLDEVAEVVRCLDGAGHDVHLRAHPEYLPKTFWRKHGFKYRPRFLSQYADDKGAFTIKHFGKFISDLKVKLMLAFRAESFHWNADTIRAFGAAGIPLSFSNSMSADLEVQYTYSEATNKPYVWLKCLRRNGGSIRHSARIGGNVCSFRFCRIGAIPLGEFCGRIQRVGIFRFSYCFCIRGLCCIGTKTTMQPTGTISG